MDFNKLVAKIEQAYREERIAAAFYSELLAQAPDYDSTQALLETRHDELKHASSIANILYDLTGREPADTPVVIPEYSTFEEGMSIALQGEKDIIEFYDEIINMTSIEIVKALFTEMKQIETVHYVKFLALLRFNKY